MEVRKLKHVIKERAKNETTPVPKIYDEETARFCLTSLAIAIVPLQRKISIRIFVLLFLKEIIFKDSSLNKARHLQTPVIPNSQIFDIPDAYTKPLKGEENRFNHLMIQMKASLSIRPKTAKTRAIQQRLDTLYSRYNNSEIGAMKLFDGLSYVVAKKISSKKK
ncbi:unnamed protein product [Rotaria sordida]|uniref:Uncharacterized protein n=1 Tax=Rotaria sordida TaxID=392033 RepID=A0A815ACY2_9BILA|nr:unnamed protein product [Rotaria sordida]CAF1536414.1 unnamed protein product [Rotaria sordida]